MSWLRHRIEAAALWILFGLLRALPLDSASALGGWLARAIGPRLRAHRIAQENLRMVYPNRSEAERRAIITGMWNHLGRVAAELPHLPTEEMARRITVEGEEHLQPERPVLFFSGHIGNWELLPQVATRAGVKLALVYRLANNPLVDRVIARIRAQRTTAMVAKGPQGAVGLVRAIKGGLSIAMLIDQKMNEGIAAPFFGRTAMTAPALAQLALRYDMPIVPARVIRLSGARFKTVVSRPLAYEKTGDAARDTLAIMTEVNRTLEGWIHEHPEQWFWVHRRWPHS